MKDELSLSDIDVYAKDAIDDLDVSILDAIKAMQIGDFNGDFSAQIQQYLRVKSYHPNRENDLEKDARRILIRIIEMLND